MVSRQWSILVHAKSPKDFLSNYFQVKFHLDGRIYVF